MDHYLLPTTLPDAFNGMSSQHGQTLHELSAAAPVLLVFLRQLGCPFCRQTLADLREAREDFEQSGVGLALVHMADEPAAAVAFAAFGLADVPRFSDRARLAYQAMNLGTAPVREVLGGRAWRQAYQAAVREGHGVGPVFGHVLQMPGVFVVDRGQIVAGRASVRVGDRPDYRRLLAERAFAGV